MKEIIQYQQSIKEDMHAACVEVCAAQKEVWAEKALAQRCGRWPRKGPTERWMAAEARLEQLRLERRMVEDAHREDGESKQLSGFPRPPWVLTSP